MEFENNLDLVRLSYEDVAILGRGGCDTLSVRLGHVTLGSSARGVDKVV